MSQIAGISEPASERFGLDRICRCAGEATAHGEPGQHVVWMSCSRAAFPRRGTRRPCGLSLEMIGQ